MRFFRRTSESTTGCRGWGVAVLCIKARGRLGGLSYIFLVVSAVAVELIGLQQLIRCGTGSVALSSSRKLFVRESD